MSCAVLRRFQHFHSARPHASITTFYYKVLLFYAPPREKKFLSNKCDHQESDMSPFWRNLIHLTDCAIMNPFYRWECGGSKLLLIMSSLVDSLILVPSQRPLGSCCVGCFGVFLATPHGVGDLSSPTRN